jgi:hypothetical protein
MFEGGNEYKFNAISGNYERVETALDRRVRESVRRTEKAIRRRPEADPFAAFVGTDLPH